MTHRRHIRAHERTCFFVAATILVALMASYMYFVSASVVHVVMRKETSQQLAELGSYVSQLEAQYIEAQHMVSEDIATMRGYVAVTDKVFIDKADTALAVRSSSGG